MRTIYKVQTPTPPAPFQPLKFFPILAYAEGTNNLNDTTYVQKIK